MPDLNYKKPTIIDGKYKCEICGGLYYNLGSHITKIHHIMTDDYRGIYGYRLTEQLSTAIQGGCKQTGWRLSSLTFRVSKMKKILIYIPRLKNGETDFTGAMMSDGDLSSIVAGGMKIKRNVLQWKYDYVMVDDGPDYDIGLKQEKLLKDLNLI